MTKIQFNDTLIGLKDKLFFFALQLTSNHVIANDLLQETFLKAFSSREKFRHNTNFKGWVFTIMRNTFINDYRRKIFAGNIIKSENYDLSLNYSDSKTFPAPDSLCNTIDICKCIYALEDEYRIPFTMFIDGYKYSEIAEKLNIPVGTVKTRIFISRKKLKINLNELFAI